MRRLDSAAKSDAAECCSASSVQIVPLSQRFETHESILFFKKKNKKPLFVCHRRLSTLTLKWRPPARTPQKCKWLAWLASPHSSSGAMRVPDPGSRVSSCAKVSAERMPSAFMRPCQPDVAPLTLPARGVGRSALVRGEDETCPSEASASEPYAATGAPHIFEVCGGRRRACAARWMVVDGGCMGTCSGLSSCLLTDSFFAPLGEWPCFSTTVVDGVLGRKIRHAAGIYEVGVRARPCCHHPREP